MVVIKRYNPLCAKHECCKREQPTATANVKERFANQVLASKNLLE
jgi:hypothetical protein